MISTMDERKGLVKVYWPDIRERVFAVEPRFAKIVDQLNVDHRFPLYLAYYPYGALTGDTVSAFFPKINNSFYRLTDLDVPKSVIQDLGYSKNSSPLALLLDKNLELFLDLKDQQITIPRNIYRPGCIFPLEKILHHPNHKPYAPHGVLTLTSGARSTFMLPNIGCATNHANLQRDFNIKSGSPKSLYEHWRVFKEVLSSSAIYCEWRSCLLYFSENWLSHIFQDLAWLPLKSYLHELASKHYEYDRSHFYYDIIFSILQKRRNLKPNPYLADTARHLFTIAMGAAPGYAPAYNDEFLPVNVLQKVFVESYGLKKYFPTLMHVENFNFEENSQPIYYSLQHPSTHVFSPKSRKISSTLAELRELEHLCKVFSSELARENGMCAGTIMSEVSKNIQFDYFHNKLDSHGVIKPSVEIPLQDLRFRSASLFAGDAPFVRGCVSMRRGGHFDGGGFDY